MSTSFDDYWEFRGRNVNGDHKDHARAAYAAGASQFGCLQSVGSIEPGTDDVHRVVFLSREDFNDSLATGDLVVVLEGNLLRTRDASLHPLRDAGDSYVVVEPCVGKWGGEISTPGYLDAVHDGDPDSAPALYQTVMGNPRTDDIGKAEVVKETDADRFRRLFQEARAVSPRAFEVP